LVESGKLILGVGGNVAISARRGLKLIVIELNGRISRVIWTEFGIPDFCIFRYCVECWLRG
jgi:hypothetical protein